MTARDRRHLNRLRARARDVILAVLLLLLVAGIVGLMWRALRLSA
ncbi:hypothetical protein [Falsiroseomonas frigidaquae]|nr:hypothetical protein [Falsiroseomonas frigidaquae]